MSQSTFRLGTRGSKLARVQADNGQSVVVDIELPRRAFAHWSADASQWLYEAGTFDVLVGDNVMSTPLRSAWELTDADVLANTGR